MSEMMMPLTGNETTARFAHSTAQWVNRNTNQAARSLARAAGADAGPYAHVPVGAGPAIAAVVGIGAALFLAAAATALV